METVLKPRTEPGAVQKIEAESLSSPGRIWKAGSWAVLWLSILILFPAVPLAAQDGEESIAVEAITVTSTRAARDLRDIPLTVSVVGQEAIEDHPRQDAAEYVRDVPGVQVTQNSYGQYTFSLRGYGSGRTLLLVDGIRQKISTSLLSNEFGGITVDPWQIERIEVIKGPASALYGSDAIGGVISIITKKRPDKPFSFAAGFTYDGSREGYSPRASVSGTSGGFYINASGLLIENKNLKLPGGRTLYHSDNHTEIYTLRSGYEWDQGSLDFSLSRSEGWRNLPAIQNWVKDYQVSPAVIRANNMRYSRVPREIQQQAGAVLTLNNLSAVLERLVFQAYLTDSEAVMDFFGFTFSGTGVYQGAFTVLGRDKAKGFGGSVQADLVLPADNKLTLGFDYDRNEAHSTGVYGGLYKARGIQDEDRKGVSSSFAFFAQNEWRPVPALGITGGLRYSVINNKLAEDRTFPGRTDSSRESNVVGSLGAVFSATGDLSFRALYSQGFRSPTLTQQFMGGTQRYLANPDLKPERSNNFELGTRYAADGLSLDLALFYSTLKDAFYDQNTGRPHPLGGVYYQVQNSDRARAAGAELEVSYEIQDLGLTPFVSMTAMRYKREYSNGYRTSNTGVPHTWGQGGLRYSKNINSNVRLFGEASLTWSGGFFDESPDGIIQPQSQGGSAVTKFYDSAVKGDLTLGLEAGEEHKYRATLSLRNIGSNDFQPWGFFQPGFHAVAAVGFQY